MISLAYDDGSKVRVEGTRVIIPGFEYIEAYATPYSRWRGIIDYDKWMIINGISGYVLHTHKRPGFSTIDEAIDAAVKYCKSKRVTEKKYQQRLHTLSVASQSQANAVIK